MFGWHTFSPTTDVPSLCVFFFYKGKKKRSHSLFSSPLSLPCLRQPPLSSLCPLLPSDFNPTSVTCSLVHNHHCPCRRHPWSVVIWRTPSSDSHPVQIWYLATTVSLVGLHLLLYSKPAWSFFDLRGRGRRRLKKDGGGSLFSRITGERRKREKRGKKETCRVFYKIASLLHYFTLKWNAYKSGIAS